jgi:curved DNA-binding protein CbpA
VKICNEIIKCKDYYAVLGVERTVSEPALRKAYKRRAMKVHPDKNSAPKATDAFKKVNAAMACLTDADKRRVYD